MVGNHYWMAVKSDTNEYMNVRQIYQPTCGKTGTFDQERILAIAAKYIQENKPDLENG
jgi:hypothetical protein